jgi:hypothetical protein
VGKSCRQDRFRPAEIARLRLERAAFAGEADGPSSSLVGISLTIARRISALLDPDGGHEPMTSAAAGLALRQDDLVVPRPARRASAKPVLRLIHHMARSGGTVISRCLGCMSGVILLSEIHPLGIRQFNPLAQAQRWFGLLSSHDLAALAARGQIGFADAIELIHRRAEECNQRLVVRDWSHLDFTGVPFVARPATGCFWRRPAASSSTCGRCARSGIRWTSG